MNYTNDIALWFLWRKMHLGSSITAWLTYVVFLRKYKLCINVLLYTYIYSKCFTVPWRILFLLGWHLKTSWCFHSNNKCSSNQPYFQYFIKKSMFCASALVPRFLPATIPAELFFILIQPNQTKNNLQKFYSIFFYRMFKSNPD